MTDNDKEVKSRASIATFTECPNCCKPNGLDESTASIFAMHMKRVCCCFECKIEYENRDK